MGDRAWENDLMEQKIHKEHGISIVPFSSPLYPKGLKDIANPPPTLFVKGNVELLQNQASVAIVGSREATTYGLQAAEKITAHFTDKNHVIVSGLATGIDAAAHLACLSNGGKTIAVLAHGLHRVYPSENSSLAEEILNKGGALVSEHAIGVEPKRHFFVQRNRIQVGLSQFSIIVEAKKKSGTLTHAEFCLKANHPLYAVEPHTKKEALSTSFEGNMWLIDQKKAIPLRSKNDYPIIAS